MGLNYQEELCDRVFLLPAKFPMFLPETIEKMLESEAELTYPAFEGRKGHPVLVSAGIVDKILHYDGPWGLSGALRQMAGKCSAKEIAVEDKGIIFPIETDADSLISFVKEQRIQVHPKVQLSLGRDDSFFGPSLAQFLTLVDHTGSMQTACRQMHMSYTKGWKILKEAEKQLGYPLLLTQSGGAEGGFSQLTPKTKEFLGCYLKMEEALRKEGERLFRYYFSQEKEQE